MRTNVEMTTAETQPCHACGRRHRVRLALLTAEPSDGRMMLGFFGTCPVAMQRTWLVIGVPVGADGASRFLRMGPPDQDGWEPDDLESIRRAVAVDACTGRRAPAARPAPRRKDPPLRDLARVSDLLRRTLGCPIS